MGNGYYGYSNLRYMSDTKSPPTLPKKQHFRLLRKSLHHNGKAYKFLVYDEEFKRKLKNFREQHGLMKTEHKKTLDEISIKIANLERRLHNAKSARDAYVEYLKLKYPLWKPAISSYVEPVPQKVVKYKDDMMGNLQLAEHLWEESRPNNQPRFQNSVIYDSRQRGSYRLSDIPVIQQRIEEISNQLRALSSSGMNFSVEDYMRNKLTRTKFDNDEANREIAKARYLLETMNLNADRVIPSAPPPPLVNNNVVPNKDHLLEEIQRLQAAYDSTNQQISSTTPATTEQPPNAVPKEQTMPPPEIVERKIVFNSQPNQEANNEPKIVPNINKESSPTKSNNNESYSKLMNILAKKDTISDSDDDDVKIPTEQAPKSMVHPTPIVKTVQEKKENQNTSGKGSLSMYLSQIAHDSSSSEDLFTSVKKKNDLDSDSDFFG